jgi:lipoprotein-anchoring transpeptidase ErfK/SrfK
MTAKGWGVAALTAAALLASTPGAAGAGRSGVPAVQRLAVLDARTAAHARPSARARLLATIAGRRPITGAPTTLPVDKVVDRGGTAWLRVLLPGRPNGRHGWIAARAARRETTPWRIAIDLATRTLTVFDRGRARRSFAAVVGAPSTPTPVGRFFVEETVELPAWAPGAPYALALSARSHVLQEFDGGPGQIAIHGIANIGGVPGQAASHGCIRLTTAAIRWIVAHVGPGAPVDIRP